MNHVFLAGIAETAPKIVSQSSGVLHAIMNLTVVHKTAAGVEKHEQYPISAWRGIAKRMTEMIAPGSRVSIMGYLSQKQTPEGVFLEVTVEEFQVSVRSTAVRPMRRNMSPLHPDFSTNLGKQKSDLQKENPVEIVAEDADTVDENDLDAIQ